MRFAGRTPYYNHFVLRRRSTWLSHPDASARLWDGLLYAGMGSMKLDPDAPPEPRRLEDYADLIPLDIARPVTIGPFAIECRPTIHSVPTTALRIEAAGRTFAFSADTAHDPALIDWLAPADLIVHEATALPQSLVHTPYARLAELPEALRARMRLNHLPDDFDADSSAIELLREGRIYRV